MINAKSVTKMPSHPQRTVDWQPNPSLYVANHGGANFSFSYIAPVSKYVEAYALGPNWVSYKSYNSGNQPYNFRDYSGRQTPIMPNWLALQKVSPKSSAPAIQAAQLQMARLLAARTGTPIPNLTGG